MSAATRHGESRHKDRIPELLGEARLTAYVGWGNGEIAGSASPNSNTSQSSSRAPARIGAQQVQRTGWR